jgi:hypothetical protein
MSWTSKEKEKCKGYFDTVGGKQVPVACPTDSLKSADAARCRACHALYRKAAKVAPIDTPMGREYESQRITRMESLDRRKRQEEIELQARFDERSGVFQPPKSSSGRKHYLFDSSETGDKSVPSGEFYFGIPPHPGKRAKEERGHLEYDYPGRVFSNPDEDTGRKGNDWLFTTWTVSSLADVDRPAMTTPTMTKQTKSGRKVIQSKDRDISQMSPEEYRIGMKKRGSPLGGIKQANFVFQCFDCGRHKSGSGSRVLSMFCEKCGRISASRKDASKSAILKASNSWQGISTGLIPDLHPQTAKAKKSHMKYKLYHQDKSPVLEEDGTHRIMGFPVVQFVDRYFVKAKKWNEIELRDTFF